MKALIYLHHPVPPFRPLRLLLTATNVDRVHPLYEPGQLTFEVSEAEATQAALTDGMITGTDDMRLLPLKEGMAVVDRSTEPIEPWLWSIDRVGFDIASGMIQVECVEWRELLYRRTVPLSVAISGVSAPTAVTNILRSSGPRAPTHVLARGLQSGLRVTIPALTPETEEQPLGGMSMGEAFDQLAEQTDGEWWLDYLVKWRSVQPILRWGYRRGRDRSYFVQLHEGFHLTAGAYSRDGGSQARNYQTVGAGAQPATRPAGTKSVGAAVTMSRQESGGRVEEADERTRREALKRSGPGVSGETVQVVPSVDSQQALLDNSGRQLTIPISALEQVEAVVASGVRTPTGVGVAADDPLVRIDWGELRLGDRFTIAFASNQLRQGVTVVCRITALQPDEAEGELVLALEVQP